MKSIAQNKAKETRIFKAKKEKGEFTQMNNEIINNPDLSFKAKAILMYALSKPSHWKLSITEITKNTKDSEKAIRSGMQELIENGYMKRYPKYENKKIKEWIIEVYEKPIKDGQTLVNPLDAQKVDVGKVDVGNGNHKYLSNTDFSNKDLSNKEKPPFPPVRNININSGEQEEKTEKAGGEIYKFIKNNFTKETQNILSSLEASTDSKYFSIAFLKSFKEAEPKIKYLRIAPLEIKKELYDILLDLKNGLKIEKSLTGFIINRFKNPNWKEKAIETKDKSIKNQIGETSYK